MSERCSFERRSEWRFFLASAARVPLNFSKGAQGERCSLFVNAKCALFQRSQPVKLFLNAYFSFSFSQLYCFSKKNISILHTLLTAFSANQLSSQVFTNLLPKFQYTVDIKSATPLPEGASGSAFFIWQSSERVHHFEERANFLTWSTIKISVVSQLYHSPTATCLSCFCHLINKRYITTVQKP